MDQDELICNSEKLKSASIAIKNGLVISSECQGVSYLITTIKLKIQSKLFDLSILNSDPSFCLRIQSSPINCNSGTWSGSPISLLQNNIAIDTLVTGFRDFKYCVPLNQVDLESDIFSLEIQGRDGVSFTRKIVFD